MREGRACYIVSPQIFSSVQFSRSVVSDSLRPCESQHARLPYPSLSPGISLSSCPLSQWCHPTISTSVVPFFCPQSFSASGSFPMSWLIASDSQIIGASALASVLPMYIQGWFPLGLTGLISLQLRVSQESFPAPQYENISTLALSLLYGPTLTSIHDYWKINGFDYVDFYWQSNVSAF